MFLLEKLFNDIAAKIAVILNLDKDREEILACGAFSFMHTIWSILLIAVFGLLFDSLLEIFIISLTVATLRKYSGVAHATSPNRCSVISVVIFGGLSVMIRYSVIYWDIWPVLFYQAASFALTCYILYRYCPVDTPNKLIKKKELKEKFQKASFSVTFIFLGITVFLWAGYFKLHNTSMMSSIVSLCTGMLWQSATLTNVGHFIVNKLDLLLQNVHFTKGVENLLKENYL